MTRSKTGRKGSLPSGERPEGATRTRTRSFDDVCSHTLKMVMQAPENMSAERGFLLRGLLFRGHADFFRIADDGKAPAMDSYVLPPEFQDWEEWNKIVVSMLKARAMMELANSERPRDLAETFLTRCGLVADSAGGFDNMLWQNLFSALQKGGKVKVADALGFFRRIQERRRNDKNRIAHPYPKRQAIIIREWIHFAPRVVQGLCTMDNPSAALRLAELEGGDIHDPMTPANFSREKSKLQLVNCRKPSWKVGVDKGSPCIVER